MIYVLFTDATYRTMEAFVDRFESQSDYENACEEVAGVFNTKLITEIEYNNVLLQIQTAMSG